ncbi:hypothetical protein [Paenibacillus sp. FSL K6-2524]|uniref:hypothetical protein n=1 Tax=Paenibacillus sp. FSL K6-2524 TaxID=2954516 RepID=UPI0030FA3F4F
MSIKTERKQNQNIIQVGTMNNSTNDFNKKKNELKAFSENLPKEEILPSVPGSGGLFGWFDYKVTGSDLNTLTQNIQEKMIKQNQVLVRTIKEFNTIYDTFSALDKEYINGILISLKVAEEANAKALKGIEGVQIHQNEIKQIIDQQKQVILVLKKFKEKIEKIEHLTDVDTIFWDLSAIESNLKLLETKVETQNLSLADLTDEMKSLVSSQSVFLNDLNYLKESQFEQFQAVKQLVSNQNENISKIEALSTENKTNIEALNKKNDIHKEKLNDIKRLIQDEIQILSEKVAQKNSEFDAKLDSTINEFTTNKRNFEDDIKKLNVGIEQQAESISTYLKSELSGAKNEVAELNLVARNLSKALKITQVISFISITIICVLLVLIISGVL